MIIMLIIGWYSSMEVSLCQLLGDKYKEVLKRNVEIYHLE